MGEKLFSAERWNDKPNVKVISTNNKLTKEEIKQLEELKKKINKKNTKK